jgi:putative endonuclease
VNWYFYIISNNAHTLYTGITNDLPHRIEQHKNRTYENAFTARYNLRSVRVL